MLAPAMKTTAGTTKIITSACLKRKEPEMRTLLRALATLWTFGAPLDLPNHTPTYIGTYLFFLFFSFLPPPPFFGFVLILILYSDLPAYPWQRQRLWSESAASARRRTQPGDHALLDLLQEMPHTEWHTQLAGAHLKFMLDHVVDEQVSVSRPPPLSTP